MDKIILSGGEFGGEEVEHTEFDNARITKVDEQGNQWIYDASLSSPETTAELLEIIPAN